MSRLGFQELLQSFLGDYDRTYCERNGLFITYNPETGLPEFITKAVDLTQFDIVETDLNFIFGEKWEIVSEDKEAQDWINKWINDNNFKYMAELFVLQGLILGTTGLRFGFDKNGNLVYDIVRFVEDDVKRLNEDTEVVVDDDEYGYTVSYTFLDNEHNTVKIKEVFTNKRYERYVEGELVKKTVNRFGVPWILIGFNSPSKTLTSSDWYGEGEWEKIRPIIDEINSLHAKIDRIERLYADPKVLVTGATEAELKFEDKAWLLPNHQGSITLLEFRGNILDAMLNRLKMLEEKLKRITPELVVSDVSSGTGEGLRMKLQKLTKKVMRLRSNYFDLLEKALELVYKLTFNKEVNFTILSELVIPQDYDSLLKEVTTLYSLNSLSLSTMLTKLGYDSETEIRKIQEEASNMEIQTIKTNGLEQVNNVSTYDGRIKGSDEDAESVKEG